jgi:MarR family transcriptional regulator, negative regulator of the multidrug operon emrRAB
MHDIDRTANLLGAAALAVTDLTLGAVTKAADVSASGAAALVTLSANPGLSVTELGRRIGLTQSAAARMVDSMQADGLVERRPSSLSSRWIGVHLTTTGKTTAHRLLAARGSPLTDIVATLDADDQEALARVLSNLLARLYAQIGKAQYMCRLCDRDSCVRECTCPVGAAERGQQSHA